MEVVDGGPVLGVEVSQVGRGAVLLVCDHIAWHLVGGGAAGHVLAVVEVVGGGPACGGEVNQIGRGAVLVRGNHNAWQVVGGGAARHELAVLQVVDHFAFALSWGRNCSPR